MRTNRRGSQVIEVGLVLPILLVLSAGAIDVGQYFYASERVAAVASEGARAGAVADPARGEDAIALATAASTTAWQKTGLRGSLAVVATLEGAAPSQRIVVRTTVSATPVFDFVPLVPPSMTAMRTVLLANQEE